MRRAAVAVLAAALVLTGCSGTSSSPAAVKQLPKVTLASYDGGKPLDLGTLRGPAVINVWASYCGPCRHEMPVIQSYAVAHQGKVAVIGVDYEDTVRSRATALLESTGARYPQYLDPDGHLATRVLPMTVLVDAQGKVVHRAAVVISSQAQLEKLVQQYLKVSS